MKNCLASSRTIALPERLLPDGISTAWWKSNLAFALLHLPIEKRRDMMVFYQFCRVLDDLADDTLQPLEFRAEFLALWGEAIAGRKKLPWDLQQVIDKHTVPQELLQEIHAGVSSDLTPKPFATWDSLEKYCQQVAVSVGLISNCIVGCKSPGSKDYAHNLGLALQLTNILRDVREDAAIGRVYFAIEDLVACGVSREEILSACPGPNFARLWQHQARRAWSYFDAVACGPPLQDRPSLAAAETMRKLYSKLLLKMEKDGARVWQKRYRLSWIEKLWAYLGGNRA